MEVVDAARRRRPHAAALVGRDVAEVGAGAEHGDAGERAGRRVHHGAHVRRLRREDAAVAERAGAAAVAVVVAAGRQAHVAVAMVAAATAAAARAATAIGRVAGAEVGVVLSVPREPLSPPQPAIAIAATKIERRLRMRPPIASAVPSETGPFFDGEAAPVRRPRNGSSQDGRSRATLAAVPRVTIEPLGVTLDCNEGESVFACARRHNVFIPTACAGKATCGLCRVKMIAGDEHVTPINRDEQKHLGNTYFITKLRLSCQLRPTRRHHRARARHARAEEASEAVERASGACR